MTKKEMELVKEVSKMGFEQFMIYVRARIELYMDNYNTKKELADRTKDKVTELEIMKMTMKQVVNELKSFTTGKKAIALMEDKLKDTSYGLIVERVMLDELKMQIILGK